MEKENNCQCHREKKHMWNGYYDEEERERKEGG